MVPLMLGFISFLSMIHAYNYDGCWKQCGGTSNSISGFLYFRDNKPLLSWPFIYKDEKLVGYAIMCIADRLIIYSIEDGEFGEYIEN